MGNTSPGNYWLNPRAPQLFLKKFRMKKDLLLIIENKNPETHIQRRTSIHTSFISTSGQDHQLSLNFAGLLVSPRNYR